MRIIAHKGANERIASCMFYNGCLHLKALEENRELVRHRIQTLFMLGRGINEREPVQVFCETWYRLLHVCQPICDYGLDGI
ncbi:hypothetical protein KSB_80720 [Ktedonobacter robiniae]|uniref:Uncharacterized protein n=1 Tax=Ktedonobacter robiniae TaxID=2778365 RepID=A0ABQ3V4A7_9CHLR|nr:hypothetical protein KSB_80720 [Ktedonobacter robiniae]